MEDRERIAELAKAYVCPLNLNPSTPYEIGAVRQYVAFALMVIEQLGYRRIPELELLTDEQVEGILEKGFEMNFKPTSQEHIQRFIQWQHDRKAIEGER